MIPRLLLAAAFLGANFLCAEDGHGDKVSAAAGTPANPLTGKMLAGFGVSATKKGIRIRHVYRNSPADRAGIRPGDLIEKIDDQTTIGMSAEEFSGRIMAGDPHELVVISGGFPRTATITKADGATFAGMLPASAADFLDLKVGDEAPDFEVVTAAGQAVKLSELRSRLVLINFTATWCESCREQAPELVETFTRFRDHGLEIVSVYLDSADTDVRAYAKKLGVTWPIRNDEKTWQGDVAQAYGVSAVPTYVLVGTDGKISRIDFQVPTL